MEELRAHNATLRGQLEAEREANSENRRIIAALTQRIPELESPRDQAPPQEPSGRPQTAAEGPDKGAAGAEPERPAERPWWRRVFGT